MPKRHKLSRREFLKIAGIAASAATLGACTSRVPIEVAPTATLAPVSESASASPTATRSVAQRQLTPKKGINPIVPEMVLVEAGSFEMGSTHDQPDERPVHTVHITQPFYIGKYEVTFEEYDRFCEDVIGQNKPPDRWGRGDQPVIHVDWYQAVAYCNWLSEKEGLAPCYTGKGRVTKCDFSADGYRLPTEAEWEYAARGGRKSKGYVYAGSDNPDDVAWYADNSDDQTHPVGQKQSNELGLHDMSGNMFEWCWDLYDKEYYASSPSEDPTGPTTLPKANPLGPERVRRGSNWRENADSLRVTFRSFDGASYPGDNGFRLVRTEK